MSKKTEKSDRKKNIKCFYITDSNIDVLIELRSLLISEPNMTKLVNYAIDSVLATWQKAYKTEAKTPAQKEKSNFNLSNEVKKYVTSEKNIK